MQRTNSAGPRRGRGTVRNLISEAASPAPKSRSRAVDRATGGGGSGSALPSSLRGLNRSSLSVAVVPFACLGIMCCFSLMQRATAAIIKAHQVPTQLGRMTAGEAEDYADTICSAVTGADATTVDVSGESAYSWRRHTPIREWNVLCDSARGEYLLRFNADTKRIYGINHLAPPDADPGSDPVDCPDCGLPLLTRSMAEKRARIYLRMTGVRPSGLEPLRSSDADADQSQPQMQWHFVYRKRTATGHSSAPLLMISIDSQSGALEHLWNPVNAL